MARDDQYAEERPARGGYALAIFVSGIFHAGLAIFAFIILPQYLSATAAPPPAYTVKVVDSLPAGDLGTHLPRLAPKDVEPPPKPVEPEVKAPQAAPSAEPSVSIDEHAVALASTLKPTPTPTPASPPTPVALAKASLEPAHATPKPIASPQAKATPSKSRKLPKAKPTVAIAKLDKTSVEERLAQLRRELMDRNIKENAKRSADESDDDSDAPESEATPSGGGPVAGRVASAGKGYGIGSGSGSEGIQQDLDFLLYYQTVQEKIKKAWTYPGGSNDLTATVDFAIGADGALSACKIGQSSNDAAYDDSVIRAIKSAAPFPAPPDKFRDKFAGGIEAEFKLGELKS